MKSLLARSLLVLTLLFGLLFAVGTAVLYELDVPVHLALVFALAVILFQYATGPRIIEWIFKIQWCDPEDLGPETAAFLRDLCNRKKIRVPRVGIIEDGNPNAFTFGHTPSDARVVVTRGLLEMLTPEEINAVVAHEVGHVCHWDVAVMTLASSVPLILYILYQWTARDRKIGGHYALPVGVFAYVAYIASQYLALLLSRVREYYADRFSADTTGQPAELSRALMKISYGLAKIPYVDPKTIDKKDKKKKASAIPAHSLGSLGISSGIGGHAFALSAINSDGSYSQETMTRAMQWDLRNPWSRWFEWHCTHPLTAHRIRAMEALHPNSNRNSNAVIDSTNYWPKFWVDFFFGALFWVGFVAAIPLLSWKSYDSHIHGVCLALFGAGWLGRLGFVYQKRNEAEKEVASLAQEVEVSHLRPIPAVLKGTIIGRGVPGLFCSKDLVLQDETGFIMLLYRQPLRILDFLFGVCDADQMIGQEVVARGWYRRGPGPVLELNTLQTADGKTLTCLYPTMLWALATLCFVAGVILALLPL